MTTFLIDYENVREDGLNGLLQLPSEDRVIIFYTAENERISLKWFAGTKATLTAVKVAPGAQSLDKHLVSYLGFLAGCEDEPDNRYVVVSRDNGYKSLAAFWNSRFGADSKVCVRPQIKEEVQEKQPEPVVENVSPAKPAPVKPVPVKPTSAKPAPVKADEPAPQYTQEDLDALAETVIGIVTETGAPKGNRRSMLMSSLCDSLSGNPVYRQFREKSSFKASSFMRKLSDKIIVRRINTNVWVEVKVPVEEETAAEAEVKTAAEDVPQLNAALIETGLTSEEAESLAALIEQLKQDGKNVKQRVYRECLRRFQKERGLNVYNRVKSII